MLREVGRERMYDVGPEWGVRVELVGVASLLPVKHLKIDCDDGSETWNISKATDTYMYI